jgi:hypothetical protein
MNRSPHVCTPRTGCLKVPSGQIGSASEWYLGKALKKTTTSIGFWFFNFDIEFLKKLQNSEPLHTKMHPDPPSTLPKPPKIKKIHVSMASPTPCMRIISLCWLSVNDRISSVGRRFESQLGRGPHISATGCSLQTTSSMLKPSLPQPHHNYVMWFV